MYARPSRTASHVPLTRWLNAGPPVSRHRAHTCGSSPPTLHPLGPSMVPAVNPPDLQSLRSGALEAREAHVHHLLDRAEANGDESAIAALHVLVRDYREFHRSLYSRAMNHAAVFADAGLQDPLLAALGDTRYNCQAWAAMG